MSETDLTRVLDYVAEVDANREGEYDRVKNNAPEVVDILKDFLDDCVGELDSEYVRDNQAGKGWQNGGGGLKKYLWCMIRLNVEPHIGIAVFVEKTEDEKSSRFRVALEINDKKAKEEEKEKYYKFLDLGKTGGLQYVKGSNQISTPTSEVSAEDIEKARNNKSLGDEKIQICKIISRDEEIEKDREKANGYYVNEIKDGIEKIKKYYEYVVGVKGDESLMSKKDNKQVYIQEELERLIGGDGRNTTKQLVLTGAPGTGKTYSVLQYVKEQCRSKGENGEHITIDDLTKYDGDFVKTKDGTFKVNSERYRFVQFHPSYDYSDFVEGLRPVTINDKTTFVRIDGVFKEFCRKIVERNEEEDGKDRYNRSALDANDEIVDPDDKYYFVIDEINRADLSKVFGELMFGLEETYRGKRFAFKTQYANLRAYGIPEKGKLKDEYESYYKTIYDVKNINDIEDAAKKGEAISIKKDCFENGFFIPQNLYIIGTMNDIDRSVESFDFALRRRFYWEEIKANEVMLPALKGMLGISENEPEKVEKLSKIVNDKIINMNKKMTEGSDSQKMGLTEAYNIGPAYFKSLNIENDENYNGLDEIFKSKIGPIVKEYTRGRDPKQVEKILSEYMKALGLKEHEQQQGQGQDE